MYVFAVQPGSVFGPWTFFQFQRYHSGWDIMDNRDSRAAWRYHEGTKHPHGPLMNPWHRFDPARQPLLFKRYLGVEQIPLPEIEASTGRPALEALAGQGGGEILAGDLDLEMLASLLFYSAGITKRLRYPWGELPFRAAACTGALYHIELYVVCGELPGLAAGVYHFDPEAMALDVLRRGDFRPYLVGASGQEDAVSAARAVVIYTDVFWRNACKYQARAYRHSFWDSGTILSHSLALAEAQNLPARVVMGFTDREVDRLLGLEERREAALALLALGSGGAEAAVPSSEFGALTLETQPISRVEIDFPAIHDLHAASSLADESQVRSWREGDYRPPAGKPAGAAVALDPLALDELPRDALEDVIIRRGSSRRFARESISFKQLSTILTSSTGPVPLDYRPEGGGELNRLYLSVHAVDGLEPGAYVFDRDRSSLDLLKAGDYRRVSGSLGLGQALAADAGVNIFFLADLPGAFRAYGNRGYRLAQMEASIKAGKMYLAAYALGLGATGLTFYDDQVVEFFSPHAADRGVMFLVALGVPGRRIT